MSIELHTMDYEYEHVMMMMNAPDEFVRIVRKGVLSVNARDKKRVNASS